ncbi:hypothetical protein [Catenovulum adriaticum]|uniref:DUF4124 domain-containing protein n=1 Tax=Catenovulum adriaticum TaxID=2984846 RepID=A0ABY7ALT9_9ALTE|nr:hypothetical protein [Catenovulum sp. TS8]WAJ70449.1 hypothetical protein OLW01_01125 [Catenovulum sp. TS8]
MYRNSEGTLVFSDKPHPEATIISVKSKVESIPASQPNKTIKSSPAKKNMSYQLNILQPKSQATIRSNPGQLTVSLNVSPNRPNSAQLKLWLDGAVVKTLPYRAITTLENVYRGEHQLKVELIDSNGKLIASSQTVTFYMHQASIVNTK